MKAIGLTGSIATGKSTALDDFAALGIPVFSADAAVHALYGDPAVIARIEALFPGTTTQSEVDRAALARALIETPERLSALETLIHPLVRERVTQFLATARTAGANMAVVDIPLLFETGHDYGFDAVVVTVVDAAIQRQRALARPGMTVEKLETILARQLPQAEKRQRADYIIDTGGTLSDTDRQVAEIVAAINAQDA